MTDKTNARHKAGDTVYLSPDCEWIRPELHFSKGMVLYTTHNDIATVRWEDGSATTFPHGGADLMTEDEYLNNRNKDYMSNYLESLPGRLFDDFSSPKAILGNSDQNGKTALQTLEEELERRRTFRRLHRQGRCQEIPLPGPSSGLELTYTGVEDGWVKSSEFSGDVVSVSRVKEVADEVYEKARMSLSAGTSNEIKEIVLGLLEVGDKDE